jgi:hypothetical protein
LEQLYDWWRTYGHDRYLKLFKMATDYLAIPSTSCNCEHAFSSAWGTITDNQNRLSSSTMKALQLQKNWVRRGVVKSGIIELAKRVESLTKTSDFGSSDSALNSSQNITPSQ